MVAFVGSGMVLKPDFAYWLGTGRKDSFKGANLTTDELFKLGLEPGKFFPYEGSVYGAVRARAVITGEGYTLAKAAAWKGNVATPFPKDTITHDIAGITAGRFKDGKSAMWTDAGTGRGQWRKVLDNTATTITVSKRQVSTPTLAATDLPDALTTVLDATTDLSIVTPYDVVESPDAAAFVSAVSLGAVTAGNWTIVYVAGPFALFRGVGSTNGFTAGGVAVPSATAGTAKGPATAEATVADVAIQARESRVAFGRTYDAYTGAAALVHGELFGLFA